MPPLPAPGRPALDWSLLPSINATLNGVAASLLVVGRLLVRRGRVDAHRRFMQGAFATSCLFLVLYVTHKVGVGFRHTSFEATGWVRTTYLIVLGTHVSLAMVVPPLAVQVMRLGLRGERARHRRWARVAWPIWMYVSLTGVVIYWALYHSNMGPGRAG